MRRVRAAAVIGVVVVSAAALSGCAGGAAPETSPSSSRSATPTASASVLPSVTPSASATPRPTASASVQAPSVQEVPQSIPLTGGGIGSLSFGDQDVTAQLVEWFGPPTGNDPDVPCGGGVTSSVSWGKLVVDYRDDALAGWAVRGTNVPSIIDVPLGLGLGSSMVDVRAATGASTDYLDVFGTYATSWSNVTWYSTSADGPVTSIEGGQMTVCR